MAYADYHHCAICDCKAWYDAGVSDDWYYDALEQRRVITLCEECAKTHEIVVRKREAQEPRSASAVPEVVEEALEAENERLRGALQLAAEGNDGTARLLANLNHENERLTARCKMAEDQIEEDRAIRLKLYDDHAADCAALAREIERLTARLAALRTYVYRMRGVEQADPKKCDVWEPWLAAAERALEGE